MFRGDRYIDLIRLHGLAGQTGGRAGGAGEFPAGGIAIGGILLHGVRDHRVECRRNLPALQACSRRRLREVRADEFAAAARRERGCAGETFVQHTGERIGVGMAGHRSGVEPLRRRVEVGVQRGGAGPGGTGLTVGARDAEIGEVHLVGGGHQDVGRLDVAMHQPGRVCGVQGGRDLIDEIDRPHRIQRRFPLEQ
ncbi:hypothetical protein LBW94_016400 [Nocardia sp. alder85J]|nr:hypothetical protein [Nocardia sp. alder85J]MCX4093938.1 hypothetical protein [Nocardia sp. alder85J]